MSKLYDNYLYLKEHEVDSNNTLYLFKSGIFFIFLAEDALIASKLLNLKITYLTIDIVKCGFPISSLDKYTKILKQTPYNFKIIDTNKNTAYTINDYVLDDELEKLLSTISMADTNSLSIKEAYSFIDSIKITAQSILRKDVNNAK